MPIFDPDSDLITAPLIEGAPVEPVLEVNEIQGNILPGFGLLKQILLGIKFNSGQPDDVRQWLGSLIPFVSTLIQVNDFRNLRRRALRRGDERPLSPVFTSIAFSVNGLKILAGETDEIFDQAFRQGMAQRSRELSDPSDSSAEGHISNWITGGNQEAIPDALIILACDEEIDVLRRADEMRKSISKNAALHLIYEQYGETLDDDREHFGFRDGISQVGTRGRLSENERHFLTRRYIDPKNPLAKTQSKPGQALVFPGQFVFGYPKQREDDLLTPGDIAFGGYDWMNNGSFLVFRRLRQDVAKFRQFVAEETERLKQFPEFFDLTPELLAAKFVGRHPKGTALTRNPLQDDDDPMSDRLSVNYFGFAAALPPVEVCADPFVAIESGFTENPAPEMRTVAGAPADLFGARCPRFAHIRKVNLRDKTTDQGDASKTLTFQMLRRGVTWGKPFPSNIDEQIFDNGNRGLLFLSYQTSIVKQFELLSTKWMNRKRGPEDGGHDMLIGQESSDQSTLRECQIRSSQGNFREIKTLESWVIPTGGGYFFTPSIKTLKKFSSLKNENLLK